MSDGETCLKEGGRKQENRDEEPTKKDGVIDRGSGKASLKRHWSRDPKMREQARKIFGKNVPERETRSARSLRWERVYASSVVMSAAGDEEVSRARTWGPAAAPLCGAAPHLLSSW